MSESVRKAVREDVMEEMKQTGVELPKRGGEDCVREERERGRESDAFEGMKGCGCTNGVVRRM